MKKLLSILFCIMLFASSNAQNTRYIKLLPKSNESQEFQFEKLGEKTVKGINYRSVFTKKKIEEAAQYYYFLLSRESSKANVIVLFFNKRENTPPSKKLKKERKRINENLIGGIERIKSHFYLLSVSHENQLYRKERLILLTTY